MKKRGITAAFLAAAVLMGSVLGAGSALAVGPGETLNTEPQTEAENPYQYQAPTTSGGPGVALEQSAGSTEPDGSAVQESDSPVVSGTAPSGTEAGTDNSDGVQLIDPSGNVSGSIVSGSSGISFTDLSLTADAGKVTSDSILGLAPFIHAQMFAADGTLTSGFTSNMEAFSAAGDGFSGLKMRLENGVGDIYYRVYTAEHGWSKWAMNDMLTPYDGDGVKVQAVQLRIKGYTRNLYDFYYQATLNDGTVLDWARNGQTAGTMGTDKYIQKLQLSLWKKDVPYWQPTANHMLADNYEGVLTGADGRVYYQTYNGAAYTGWGYDLENNKYYFQEGTPVTGWQYLDGYKYYFDESGKVVTDLEPVLGQTGDYRIKVNKDMKTLTIYTKDGDNGYIIPYKVFLVTVGPDTPLGSYNTYAKYRWKFMHDDIYCQYLSRFYNGYILHSLIYRGKPDSNHLDAATYNYLGKTSSDGCIRMKAGDAAWVYNNCPTGTSVSIYNDAWVTGPYDRPAIEQAIPMSQTWDPTDPEMQGKQ